MMIIRHLCFTGLVKDHALIQFEQGLNLVYGASNTGKSAIVDGIDFMLGRERELKELPEHEGYDTVVLGVEFSDHSEFSIFRGISGGNFDFYEGLHLARPTGIECKTVKSGVATKKYDSFSDMLLKRVGLLDKKLKSNAKNETKNLTIRKLLQLFLVSEVDIQKVGSPFISGYRTEKTYDESRFRLLLTGYDDSSLVSDKKVREIELSRTVRIQVMDELIAEQKRIIEDSSDGKKPMEDLLSQIKRLNASLAEEKVSLSQAETLYQSTLKSRNSARQEVLQSKERSIEISEMLSRFHLLNDHYETDLLRLRSIEEAGSLLTALPSNDCPLCGAKSDKQNLGHDCDGNIDEVIEAASAEAVKLIRLRMDLKRTIAQLEGESAEILTTLLPLIEALNDFNQNLRLLSPDMSKARSTYKDYIDEKVGVEKAISLLDTLEKLEQRRLLLEPDTSKPTKKKAAPAKNLSADATTKLSESVKSVLDLWFVPGTDTVSFDGKKYDFVLGGKSRASNGKGHRSITHAAATLGFSKYLEDKKLPSLGFVILDSPLLAYEEPDNEEDDFTATDVNVKFFESLAKLNSIQTIVFENKKSVPMIMQSHERTQLFTKSREHGRYGYFPLEK